MSARDAAIRKVDKQLRELWNAHGRLLGTCTPADYARLWRQIDFLLDKRLTLTEVDT